MLKVIVSTLFYIISYVVNFLLLAYLTKLEKSDCSCVKNANFHYAVKNSIYVAILMPIIYIVLTVFAYVTKDKALSYSLDIVYKFLMLLINGIVSIIVFTYIQLLIKRDDCDCIKDDGSISKLHKTVHILSYIMLIGYGLYLMFYIYYKYIYEPKILLVDNGSSVKILNNNIRNGADISVKNNLNQNRKNTATKNNLNLNQNKKNNNKKNNNK